MALSRMFLARLAVTTTTEGKRDTVGLHIGRREA